MRAPADPPRCPTPRAAPPPGSGLTLRAVRRSDKPYHERGTWQKGAGIGGQDNCITMQMVIGAFILVWVRPHPHPPPTAEKRRAV